MTTESTQSQILDTAQAGDESDTLELATSQSPQRLASSTDSTRHLINDAI